MKTALDFIKQEQGQMLTKEQLESKAIQLAKLILQESQAEETFSEKLQGEKMKRMMSDKKGKSFTLHMCDRVFRPPSERKSANQLIALIKKYGIPRYFFFYERIALALGALGAKIVPKFVMPLITKKMRSETKKVILPSENKTLKPHLIKRRRAGINMNINQLGEAILGEEEAEIRLQQNLKRLADPNCDYISVKISAIFSQINLLAFEDTLEKIKERLRLLYRAAMDNKSKYKNNAYKFVNLDMEEYRDLELTCKGFKEILMEKEFLNLEAGIVLQAYLPDAFNYQKDLCQWAKERKAKGGTGIKIRIVKGANLAMEKVEASLHGWKQAPYYTKKDVDANYKRMLCFGLREENLKNVRLGIASHNLFEISLAILLTESNKAGDRVEFEMLEGMANNQARVVKNITKNLLLYAPVVKVEDFHSAIAYLVRRLDENTTEENFLHDLFGMKEDSQEWEKQKTKFLESFKEQDSVSSEPNRKQNRITGQNDIQKTDFRNEPDTDWILPKNREWITQETEKFFSETRTNLPMQIGGEEIHNNNLQEGRNPSENEIIYQFSNANEENIDQALQVAEENSEWTSLSILERKKTLEKVAVALANARGRLISAMILDGGKSIPEADSEISEAIDFANYYAKNFGEDFFDGTDFAPLGTVLVIPPWNFPMAIPCGGILAALMAGNNVIIKPASQTYLIAWEMVKVLWDAGIPKKALQCIACKNNIGQKLISDSRVKGIILTGGHETAVRFLNWRPNLCLFAETSGKNSMIITSTADSDQAIKDLVKSAFGHSGQKCSAASLAIIEADVYDSPSFMKQLKDAVSSLKVGSSSNFSNVITPLIKKPSSELAKGLTELQEEEVWLLEPKMQNNNPCIWSPGIRINVRPGSWYHKTECFGPVLGLMKAKDLDEAITIQNSSEFGLTGGIQSLNEDEITKWMESVEVGNAYINRSTTGAIVQRQPFGGWKKSCFGPGAKAGGPNYVALFGKWTTKKNPLKKSNLCSDTEKIVETLSLALPSFREEITSSAKSFAYWWKEIFQKTHDPSQILGEQNLFRYRKLSHICLRQEIFCPKELSLFILAASILKIKGEISTPSIPEEWENFNFVKTIEELESSFIERIKENPECYCSVRCTNPSANLYRVTNEISLQLIDWEFLQNGRIELLHYLREQSISQTLHRYGNIIE